MISYEPLAGDLMRALNSNPNLIPPLEPHRCIQIANVGLLARPEAALLLHAAGPDMICATVYCSPASKFVVAIIRIPNAEIQGPIMEWIGSALRECRFAPVCAVGPNDTFSETISFEGAVADLADMVTRLNPAVACPPDGEATVYADLRCIVAFRDRQRPEQGDWPPPCLTPSRYRPGSAS